MLHIVKLVLKFEARNWRKVLEKSKFSRHVVLRNPRGFTMVEMMIVVAIIVVLAAVAIPFFNSYTLKTKNRMVEQNFHLAVRYVKAICQENSDCIEDTIISNLGRKNTKNPCGAGKPFIASDPQNGQVKIDVQADHVTVTGLDCSNPANTFTETVHIE